MSKQSSRLRDSSSASNRSAASSRTMQQRSAAVPGRAKKRPKKAPKQEKGLSKFLKALMEDPNALRNIRHYLPNWIDEFVAVLLISVGAVTFASLLSSGVDGSLSGSMSEIMRRLFGSGAIMVSLGVLIGGIMILLPKINIQVTFSWGRFVALEVVFICFEGVLHLAAFDEELRALAREGKGGGLVGWAVSNSLTSIVGPTPALAILSFGLVLGLHWLLQIRRHHYREFFGQISSGLWQVRERIPRRSSARPVSTAEWTQPSELPEQSEASVSATPQPAPMTPSSRPATPPGPQPAIPMPNPVGPARNTTNAAAAALTPSPAPAVLTLRREGENGNGHVDEALSARPELVVNGQVVQSEIMVRERPSIVPRNVADDEPKPAVIAPPKFNKKRHSKGRDGDPTKRYFTVDDFVEATRVGKRDDILPPYELLGRYDKQRPSEQEINKNATIIENTLLEFDIDADVIDVRIGPVVTQYAVSPIKETINPETHEREIKRVRVDRIVNLQSDMTLALSARTLRIEAPVPGHSYVGIEVPNKNPSIVGLRPILESEAFYRNSKTPLCVPLGRDVSGDPLIIDLSTLPHLLVAGTTGSGKSVFLTSVVTSLVMNNTPEQVKLIMLDPKRVELMRFNGLPHLVGPVETEADRIIGVLRWTTREMDRRYKLLELENARNIDTYNASLGRRRKHEQLPYMVVLFDEIGDLMMSYPDETEGLVTRLAQKARAAGIHLVIATQRPSVDILTGLIKANFPGRTSFAVASGTDSRVILDYTGAETLLGRGDMLYLAPDAAGPRRVQGCFISDTELDEVVMYWRGWHEEQIAEGIMERPSVPPWERGMTRLESLSEQDPMLEEAITVVCEAKEASTSLVQRRLGIGYPRAARLMDLMHELGIIGPPKSGGRTREVLVRNYKQALKQLNRNR